MNDRSGGLVKERYNIIDNPDNLNDFSQKCVLVTREIPGGKRILNINIKAQQKVFESAIQNLMVYCKARNVSS